MDKNLRVLYAVFCRFQSNPDVILSWCGSFSSRTHEEISELVVSLISSDDIFLQSDQLNYLPVTITHDAESRVKTCHHTCKVSHKMTTEDHRVSERISAISLRAPTWNQLRMKNGTSWTDAPLLLIWPRSKLTLSASWHSLHAWGQNNENLGHWASWIWVGWKQRRI